MKVNEKKAVSHRNKGGEKLPLKTFFKIFISNIFTREPAKKMAKSSKKNDKSSIDV